jgi:phosphoserine phosphatase RsbU/P
LSSMSGNLLDLSRMEAGMMEYELKDNDLVPLVRTALAELEPQAGEKGICLRPFLTEDPLPVQCDADRALQVLGNVLANAIRFSPAGECVEVRAYEAGVLPPGLPDSWRRTVRTAGQGQGYVIVTIADRGPGIPDELKEKVFERFQQAPQTRASKGQGVGLGLAICRTIMQAHHGAIWVEDNAGAGSIFWMLFPASSEGGVMRGASGPL